MEKRYVGTGLARITFDFCQCVFQSGEVGAEFTGPAIYDREYPVAGFIGVVRLARMELDSFPARQHGLVEGRVSVPFDQQVEVDRQFVGRWDWHFASLSTGSFSSRFV